MVTAARILGGRTFLLAAFAGALWLAGCGPSTAGTDTDGGGGTCTSSDPSYCDSGVFWSCVDGHWVTDNCGARLDVCVPTLGCRLCEPGSFYCSSQDVYECNADGTERTFKETCRDEDQCVLGGCVSACEAVQGDRSNVGCEFWAVDLPMDYECESINGGACIMYGCAACQQFAVVIANTSDFTVHVTVEQNDAAPGEALNLSTVDEKDVGPHGLQVFELPMREVDCTEYYVDAQNHMRRSVESTTCLTSRAYRVTSTYPVVAYQFNPIKNAYSNGASLLIPTNGLDKDHYIVGWPTTNPIGINMGTTVFEGIPDFMYVTVVGVYPNTTVEVHTTHQTQGSPDGVVPAVSEGGTITATLGPFDVLAVASIQDMQHPTGDFTGTRVTASNPVVVFSSGQRSSVPYKDPLSYSPPAPVAPSWDQDTCCTEHFEQQMFPISSLGTKFVVTRTPPRSTGSWIEPDFYRVLATRDGTVVTTNLVEFPEFQLNADQFAEFWSIEDFVLVSNEPIMVAQYAVAENYLDTYEVGGDPEFVLFPPIEQHRPEYIFLTPETFDKDYVIIAAPDGSQVFLDDEDVGGEITTRCDRHPAGAIDGVSYNAIRCPVEDGPHSIRAQTGGGEPVPVGITVYGYTGVGSYGYPGGADVKQINID